MMRLKSHHETHVPPMVTLPPPRRSNELKLPKEKLLDTDSVAPERTTEVAAMLRLPSTLVETLIILSPIIVLKESGQTAI